MKDFFTDGFSLESTPEEVGLPKMSDQYEIIRPLIGTKEKWEQYTNDLLYFTEIAFREWAEEMSHKADWANRLHRRFTPKMAFERMFGIPFNMQEHYKQLRTLAKVMAHYSTKISKGGYIEGKKTSKNIYHIMRYVNRKKPYSLRLKLEQMFEAGEIPGKFDTEIPKLLKPGHARRTRTEANMQRRSEEARRRYNERQSAKSD